MNTYGRVELEGSVYYLFLNDVKASETYYLFNEQHIEDVIKTNYNDPDKHKKLVSHIAMLNLADDGYLAEVFKRNKLSGNSFSFRGFNRIEAILSKIYYARAFNFNQNQIVTDVLYTDRVDVIRSFEARTNNLIYSYTTVNRLLKELYIEMPGFVLKLGETNKKFKNFDTKSVPLKQITNLEKKQLSVYSVKNVSFEDLINQFDISWYYENGKYKLNYKMVETIEEFEYLIMTPLILELVAKGEEFKLNPKAIPVVCSKDTETSGFGMYDLSDDNEMKDFLVSIPICWEDNRAYMINIQMENFPNVPKEYVIRRLTEISEEFKGDREITYYTPNDNYIKKSGAFGTNEEELCPISEAIAHTAIIRRNWLWTVAHNLIFDKRVFYCESVRYFKSMSKCIYFDHDTLQLAFNLNPGVTKHSRALKPIVHRLLGIESPDLTDLLGKGNEDKFRLLNDKRVAELYGCSDAWFTRKIFFILMKLTKPELFHHYQYLDCKMMNILGITEYYGLPVDIEQVTKLAENAKEDIGRIQEFIYKYIGSFIKYTRDIQRIDTDRSLGIITESQAIDLKASIEIASSSVYRFEFKPNEIKKVLFDILKYDVVAMTSGKNPTPSADKYAMQKLVDVNLKDNEKVFMKLKNHVLVSGATHEQYEKVLAEKGEYKASQLILIDKDKFNSTKNQIALVLQTYGSINKDYTSYLRPMIENNQEGRMFKGFSLARIETRRIMNPLQTMKGALKALAKPYNLDFYMLDFDMSQVEYRIMLSISKFFEMIERMKDPERDYHTETASLINFKPAHRISKKERKNAKGVSFGVPYGLGEARLCENMFKVVTEITLQQTRQLLDNWKKANAPVMVMLNTKRDTACKEYIIDDEFRDFIDMWERDSSTKEYVLDQEGKRIPIPIGIVEDEYGFYRIFNLKDLNNAKINKIRNAAGNFPIQCYAAELFRVILLRFYDRCTEEGIQDRIMWHMLVHDELLLSVHKSLSPIFMYKIILEECMLQLPNHTTYFVGINVGLSWADTKDDAREAPVRFVEEMVEKWDNGEFKDGPTWFDDPWNYVKPYREDYVKRRIGEVLSEVQPGIENNPINVQEILHNFANYTVRAYVNDYAPAYKPVADFNPKDEDAKELFEDHKWAAKLETWAIKYYGEGKEIIDYLGRHRVCGSLSEIVADATAIDLDLDIDLDIDMAELFDDEQHVDDYWTLDGEAIEGYADIEHWSMKGADEGIQRGTLLEALVGFSGTSVGNSNLQSMITLKEKEMENVSVSKITVMVNIHTKYEEEILDKFLLENKAVKGKSVVTKSINGSTKRKAIRVLDNANFRELDRLLIEHRANRGRR